MKRLIHDKATGKELEVTVIVPMVKLTLRGGQERYVKERPLTTREFMEPPPEEWIETTQGFVRSSDVLIVENYQWHTRALPEDLA